MRRRVSKILPLHTVLLVCFASAGADATATYGVRLGYVPYPVRIGPSTSSAAQTVQYRVINYRGTPASIQDFMIRTGAEFAAGTWTVHVKGCETCASSATFTTSLVPNEWNTLAPPAPTPLPNLGAVFLELESDGVAELEFLNSGVGAYVNVFEGGAPGDYVGAGPMIPSSPGEIHSGIIVVTLSGETDPFAPASCTTAAERIAVAGNPYVGQVNIPFPATGSLRQDFLAFRPYATTPSALANIYHVTVDGAGLQSAGFALSNSSWGSASGTFSGLGACFISDVAYVTPTVNSLDVSPVASGATWNALVVSTTALSECDPLARATFGGSLSKAVVNGVAVPGMDFKFAYASVVPLPLYPDADGDSRGAKNSPAVYCQPPGGYVGYDHTDCDDTRADVHPGAAENCDGADNDCDALTDSQDPDLVLTQCEATGGVCGTQHHLPTDCAGGSWSGCSPAVYGAFYEETERSCDGRDNDCDGATDETPDLDGPACVLTLGVCAGSRASVCSDAAWLACSPAAFGPHYEPTESRCDGVDNDCDGLTDGNDTIPVAACELQQGVCAGAKNTRSACGADGWAPCVPSRYGASYEVVEVSCDGLDNDCDGVADGADPGVPSALCELQAGICEGATHSRKQCASAGWRSCNATNYGPAFEVQEVSCDGLDNDCDADTDEGCNFGCSSSSAGSGSIVATMLLLVIAWMRRRSPGSSARLG